MRFAPAMLSCLLLLAALAAAPAFGGEPAFTGEIAIGATFPLSGRLEPYGQSAYYGATTRVRLINAQGGINGKKLVVHWRDNQSDAARAGRDIRELVGEHKVAAILGPLMSEGAMTAGNISDELGVVIMTPLATMDAVTEDKPWVFRTCFNNTDEARGMIKFQMNNYGATSCGILYDRNYAFSNEIAGIFEELFTQSGGRVVGNYSFIGDDGEKDYATPLRKLAAEKPDFIFAPCYALEATELIHAARDLKIAIRFCGSSTWDNELVFDASGSRLAGTSFASSLFERAFSYRPFQTFYQALERAGMDTPDAQAACAYDAVTLLAHALASGTTPEAVRDALHAVSRMPLATGRMTISPNGDAIKPVIIRVVEIQQGRLAPVYAERYDP